jgi:predicted dehydrogenase
VRCYGSGRIAEEYIAKYNSPFAVETSQMEFEDSDVVCEVTRSLFNTIRQYRESFDVYGTKLSFEWEQTFEGGHILYSGYEDAEKVVVGDTDKYLPKEIAKYCLKHQIVDENHVSFIQGAGHGGSHPHLVLEFISAILENRKAHVSAQVAANWTMAGILSHESAMNGGKLIEIPKV